MRFDLIIVGGGLAGLSLACALRESRLRIALVESGLPPSRPTGWDARVYAVTPANAAFLGRIGVWKHLDRERLCPIHAMKIVGDRGARLDLSAYEAGVDELGWILESSAMACELWENVKRQSNVSVFFRSVPQSLSVEVDAVALTLVGGPVLAAQLVVGADGRDSWVRGAAGLSVRETSYGESGVVANFSCEKSHRNIARQWFRDDGVLAWLPLPGKRISVVWSTPDAHAGTLLECDAAVFTERVAMAGHDELGALSLLTAPVALPLRLLRVARTVAQRVALIGDAAHGIHPLSGHGINLGFQDASALAGLLGAAAEWRDIGSERFLQRYQRARREETVVMQTVTDALHRLFRETLPGAAPLRNLGLAITDKVAPVKNLLVRYAIGASPSLSPDV